MIGKHTREELGAGLAETRRYILSHHEPAEYHRCYRLSVRGRDVHLCARCLGIYPGIATGLAVAALDVVPGIQPAVLLFFPAFALLDWTVTTFTTIGGRNGLRTGTGMLLGIAYGLGLWLLLVDGVIWVSLVGLGYGGVAVSLLARKYRVGPFAGKAR